MKQLRLIFFAMILASNCASAAAPQDLCNSTLSEESRKEFWDRFTLTGHSQALTEVQAHGLAHRNLPGILKGTESLVAGLVSRPLETCRVLFGNPESVQSLSKSHHYQVKSGKREYRDILKLMSCRVRPSATNSTWALNIPKSYETTGSFCAGFTSMNRKLLYLGFFDTASAPGPVKGDASYPAWIREQKKKIDFVIHGQAEKFSGVRNLSELTHHPELQKYLLERAQKEWKKTTLNLESLKTTALVQDTKEKRLALVDELKQRVERGEMPKVFMADEPGQRSWIHTLPVYDVQACPNGEIRLMVWDPDMYGFAQEKFPRSIRLLPDGRWIYPDYAAKQKGKVARHKLGVGWLPPDDEGLRKIVLETYEGSTDTMGSHAVQENVQITPDDDEEMLEIVSGLEKYCDRNYLDCSAACPPKDSVDSKNP